MSRFFESLPERTQLSPAKVAELYGRHLWDPKVLDEDKLSRSRYHVGISAGNDGYSFADLTRRATLVADTLLLSHDSAAHYHALGEDSIGNWTARHWGDEQLPSSWIAQQYGDDLPSPSYRPMTYGMHCPDLSDLGTWIMEAEPLLTAGLAWYLPNYSFTGYETLNDSCSHKPYKTKHLKAIDYLIKDGRAVDASGVQPTKSKLVRPVLHTELPFIQGVNLRDFSRITAEEFGSYTAFRNFLRESLGKLDDALDDVQSENAIHQIDAEVNDAVHNLSSDMAKAHRKRALTVTNATLGIVSASLFAVYGPAMASAFSAIAGTTGGIWSIINAMSEHSPRNFRDNKWYYVWALKESTKSTIRTPKRRVIKTSNSGFVVIDRRKFDR